MKLLKVHPYKCDGCHSCETVCSIIKTGKTGIYESRIKTTRFPEENFFLPRVCFQCETPYCTTACPTDALRKNPETCTVELYEESCTSCGQCVECCPYGSIWMVDSKVMKCDLCGGDPKCVKFCETGAITYGEFGDISRGGKTNFALMNKLGMIS